MEIGTSTALMLHPGLAQKAHQEVLARNPAADNQSAKVKSYQEKSRITNSIDILA